MPKKAIFVDSNEFYNSNESTTDPDLVAKYPPLEKVSQISDSQSGEPDQYTQQDTLPQIPIPLSPAHEALQNTRREIILRILIAVVALAVIVLGTILSVRIWNSSKKIQENNLSRTTAFRD